MTEQQIDEQIRAGFERLDGSLAPPLDAQERVARRITARRRNRRVGVGALVLVAVAGVGAAALMGGGEEPRSDDVAVDPPSGPQSTLVMTRTDGSTYAFDDVTVSCTPPKDYEQGRPGHVYLWSPIRIEGEGVAEPFVYVDATVARVEGDRTFTYPTDDDVPIVVFIADAGGGDANEAASSAGNTTGTLRVVEAACDPTPVLRLEVDLSLGSEMETSPIDLAGAVD